MAIFVCPNGHYIQWHPRWKYIRNHYKEMITKGLADPDIAKGPIIPIVATKYLHPRCPLDDLPTKWVFAIPKGVKALRIGFLKGLGA